MKPKSERIVIRDKKVRKLFKKGEKATTEKDFNELLKRAVRLPQ